MLAKLTFAILVYSTIGAVVPPQFKTCKRTDPGRDECLKVAIQEALPFLAKGNAELGVVPISPLVVPTATVGEGKGTVHVVQKYKDFKLLDLLNVKIDKVETTMKENNKEFDITIYGSCPDFKIESDYDFNGRILLLPIVGKGKCKLGMKDMKVVLRMHVEPFEKNGVTYCRAKEAKGQLDAGKVTLYFGNLFDGDERLGNEMNNILNDNWQDVFGDTKSGYEDLMTTVFQSVANSIFTKIPYDELFPK